MKINRRLLSIGLTAVLSAGIMPTIIHADGEPQPITVETTEDTTVDQAGTEAASVTVKCDGANCNVTTGDVVGSDMGPAEVTVTAVNGGTATVEVGAVNDSGTASSGITAEAEENSTVDVKADSVNVVDNGYGDTVSGISAAGVGSTVTVSGDVDTAAADATAVGVAAKGDSTVEVGGNVTALGGSPLEPVPEEAANQFLVGDSAIGTIAMGSTVNVDGTVSAVSSGAAVGAVGIALDDKFAENVQDMSDDEFTETIRKAETEISAGNIEAVGGSYGIGAVVTGKTNLNVEGDVNVGGYALEHDFVQEYTDAYFQYFEAMLDPESDTYEEDKQYIDALKEQLSEKIAAREETPGLLRAGVIANSLSTADEVLSLVSEETLTEVFGAEKAQEILANLQYVSTYEKETRLSEQNPTVTIGGDVKVEDGRLTVGLMGENAEISVGGTLEANGRVAAGAVLTQESTAELHDVNVEAETAGTAIAAIEGAKANVDGNIVVKSEDGVSSGVLLSSGEVRVSGDVTVEGENSVGATLLNLGDTLITVMSADQYTAYATPEIELDDGTKVPFDQYINVFRKLIGTGAKGENTLVVDGTIKATDGIFALDNDAARQIMQGILESEKPRMEEEIQRLLEDGVINADEDPYEQCEKLLEENQAIIDDIEKNHSTYIEYDWGGGYYDIDPEYKEQYRTALNKRRQVEWVGAYKKNLSALETAFAEAEDPNPDITTWEIDAEKDIVKRSDLQVNFGNLLRAFFKEGDLGTENGKDALEAILEGIETKNVTLNDEYADKVQNDINYIIRVGSVTGGAGNEEISIDGTRDHQGFRTAKEGEEITIFVTHGEDYELVDVTGGKYATLTKNADGTYTLKVPAGGAVQIDAVLKAIEKQQEPEEPKPEDPEEPEPEEPKPEEPEPIVIPISYYYTNDAVEWTKGSTESGDFIVKRNVEDKYTYPYFTKILVDGSEVDAKYYETKPGSVEIYLAAEYLQTLSTGTHILSTVFEDGSVDTKFIVKEAPEKEAAPVVKPDQPAAAEVHKPVVPNTADTTDLMSWMWMFIVSLLAVSGSALALKKYH